MKRYTLHLDDAPVYVGTYADVCTYIEDNHASLQGVLHARAHVDALPDTRCATLRTLVTRAPERVAVTFGKRVPVAHNLTRR